MQKRLRDLVRLACLAYFVLLTVLLLSPHPASAIGLKQVPWFPFGDIGMHLVAFFGLAVLAHAIQWPKPLGWWWIVALAAYGLTTESLQALIPHRSCELKDYCDNLLGVAVASAMMRVSLSIWLARQAKRKAGLERDTAEADRSAVARPSFARQEKAKALTR